MSYFTPEQEAEFERRYKEDFPIVDEALMQALIKKESAFNSNAESDKGAYGRTQIMPLTWPEVAKDLGYPDITFDQMKQSPKLQDLGGKAYLAKQLKKFNKNVPVALAAYNAGPGYMTEHLKNNPGVEGDLNALLNSGLYDETRDYVEKIMGNYSKVPSLEEVQGKVREYRQNIDDGLDQRVPLLKKLQPTDTAYRMERDSEMGRLKDLITQYKAKIDANPEAGGLTRLHDEAKLTALTKSFEKLKNDQSPRANFNPLTTKLSQSFLDNTGLSAVGNQEFVSPVGYQMKPGLPTLDQMQLKDNEYFESPSDNKRTAEDLRQDMIRTKYDNLSENPLVDRGTESENKVVAEEGTNKIASLLQKFKEAQAMQNRNAGLLGLLKASMGAADAFAAGRGANTTKLGNEAADFLTERVDRPTKDILDQANVQKLDYDLNSMEETINPQSQLSRTQRDFLIKMMQDLGMDTSAIKDISAKNSNDLMRSAAYLLQAQQSKESKEEARQLKREERARLSNDETKMISNYNETINALNNVLAKKLNLGINTGSISNMQNSLAQFLFNIDDETKSAFKAEIEDNLAKYIKNISGTAASERERENLREVQPKMSDDDETFITKSLTFMDTLREIKKVELDALKRQGKNVENFEGDIPLKTLPKNKTVDKYQQQKNKIEGVKPESKTEIPENVKKALENPNIGEDVKDKLRKAYNI